MFWGEGGIEAAVHAARLFLHQMPLDEAFVKLDFKNAFNSLRCDRMLDSVFSLSPSLYPLVYSSYSSPSSLFWGNEVILSAEGVQQGDPLGPLLFCLSLHRFIQHLHSPFCVAYLDDISLGGPVSSLVHDLEVIEDAESVGLVLNLGKSEIIAGDADILLSLSASMPGVLFVAPGVASLLGSLVGDTVMTISIPHNFCPIGQNEAEKFCPRTKFFSFILSYAQICCPRIKIVCFNMS